MKRVLVLGATGKMGQLVLKELADDPSIQPVAALRTAEDKQRLPKLEKNTVETVIVNIEDLTSLKKAVQDIDVLVHAIRLRGDISENALVELDNMIRKAIVAKKKIPIVIVGGAGSLKKEDGSRFWQDSRFPTVTLPRGIAHTKLREHLEQHSFKDPWAYLIPPPTFVPEGKRLGSYQKYCPDDNRNKSIKYVFNLRVPKKKANLLIEEEFLTKTISYADFALALADAVKESWRGVYLIASETNIK